MVLNLMFLLVVDVNITTQNRNKKDGKIHHIQYHAAIVQKAEEKMAVHDYLRMVH